MILKYNFLLEIGLEELPYKLILFSVFKLKKEMILFFKKNNLIFKNINLFSTNRRLILQIFDINFNNKKYIKKILLYNIFLKLDIMIKNINFPLKMKWYNGKFEYIRPISWLLLLLNDILIPISIFNINSNNFSFSNRFLDKKIKISNLLEFEEKMKENFVIINYKKRMNKIIKQINFCEKINNWIIFKNKEILYKINNSLEYPTIFIGKFNKKYLDIPFEILKIFIVNFQNYLLVFEKYNKKILPYFISFRNGNNFYINNVIKGNEKILSSRLEDALFFLNQDKKISFKDCIKKLKKIFIHEKIGNIYDKMQRVNFICKILSNLLKLNKKNSLILDKLSKIYKFDLSTNIVNEIPELHGIIGSIYINKFYKKENGKFSKYIIEYFLPILYNDKLPIYEISSILSIADKLDSIITLLEINVLVNSSSDKYSIIQKINGIFRIIKNKKFLFSFEQFLDIIYKKINLNFKLFKIKLTNKGKIRVINFILKRFKYFLKKEEYLNEKIINSICYKNLNLYYILKNAIFINNNIKKNNNFILMIKTYNRVLKFYKKNKLIINKISDNNINIKLFENNIEIELYKEFLKNIYFYNLDNNNTEIIFENLIKLSKKIDKYFKYIFIMSKNIKIKENRLKQLLKIINYIKLIINFEYINF